MVVSKLSGFWVEMLARGDLQARKLQEGMERMSGQSYWAAFCRSHTL